MAKLQRTSDTELEEIAITDGDTVWVKRRLGKDDERRRTSLMLRGQMVERGRERLTEFDAGALYDAAVFATFEVAIKKWTVKDPETNRVAEITAANIRALSDEDVKILGDALDALYPKPMTEDQAKN